VLKIDPDNREIRVALGLLYFDMKKFDLAAAEFSAVLKKNITDDKVRYLLATTYEQQKDMVRPLMNIKVLRHRRNCM